jgi:hypothetical protein
MFKAKSDLALLVPIPIVPKKHAAVQHKTPLCGPVASHNVVSGQRHDKRQKLALGHDYSGGNQ